MQRWFATALVAFLAFSSFALAGPMMAQEGSGSTAAQLGAEAGLNTVYKVGGDVSAPVLIHAVEPERPEGDANVSGSVLVNLRVDRNGNPNHIRVIHGLGMGLDEKAVMAVHRYKYKPAMKDGKPVMVELNIEVML
jgi:protein TonB